MVDLPPGLLGRAFDMRMANCYTLVRDYYRLVHGIEMRDVASPTDWWLHGMNLYSELLPGEGFALHHGHHLTLRPGDLILMAILSPKGIPNHAGVLMPGGKLLHHLPRRLSALEDYNRPILRGNTLNVYRHPSVKQVITRAAPADLIRELPHALQQRIAAFHARTGPNA